MLKKRYENKAVSKHLTVKEFNALYPDDDMCLKKVFLQRYKNLTQCPNSKCGKPFRYYRKRDRKAFECGFCGYLLYPLADTIFHVSSTSLKSWFYAIYLFSVSKNGVSAKELERHLGVTYKTAWRMAKQIRQLFTQGEDPLLDSVEVDETYVSVANVRVNVGAELLVKRL
jgi:transposase